MDGPRGLRAGRVLTPGGAVRQATVVVHGTTIVGVETGDVPVPVLDLGDDVTLLPGLIDAHVHLAFASSGDLVADMGVDNEALLGRMRANTERLLDAGVTTVRDLGDRGCLAVDLGTPLGVLAAGPPLTTPHGHCWFLGGEVPDRAAMLAAAQQRAAAGCRFLKVMVSGGVTTPGSSLDEVQFATDDLVAVVAEAHRLGLATAAHAHAPAAVVAALDAGFDTIEHCSFAGEPADEEVVRRIADTGTVVSMTLGTGPLGAPPPVVLQRLPTVLDNLGRLHRAGARLVVGTDAGLGLAKPPDALRYAPHQLAGIGVGPAEAIAMVTTGVADALGLPAKGRIAAGADADLLAVRGDPTADPQVLLAAPVGVWVAGVRVRGASAQGESRSTTQPSASRR